MNSRRELYFSQGAYNDQISLYKWVIFSMSQTAQRLTRRRTYSTLRMWACGEQSSAEKDPFRSKIVTWILHGSEAFICKALKVEAIVNYASTLITQQMEAPGPPVGWKGMRLKWFSSILPDRYFNLGSLIAKHSVIKISHTIAFIFMQDSGINRKWYARMRCDCGWIQSSRHWPKTR